MTFANLSFAEQQDLIKKSETVYVTVEGNEIKDKSVSVWLNSDKNIKANDKSNLTNVKDLKTDKELKSENGYLKLDENKKTSTTKVTLTKTSSGCICKILLRWKRNESF